MTIDVGKYLREFVYKPVLNCLQSRNPMAGFILSHTPHCTYPHREGEIEIRVDATHHISIGTIFCGNVCGSCAKAVGKRSDAVVVEGTFVDVGSALKKPQ